MKPTITGLIAVAVLAVASAANAQSASFGDMLAETGCKSRYSDEKKADVFRSKYENKIMTVTGEVADADKGTVGLKVLRSTLTWDVRIDMSDRKSTYDMQKGQLITLEFTVDGHGGCIVSFRGRNGVVR